MRGVRGVRGVRACCSAEETVWSGLGDGPAIAVVHVQHGALRGAEVGQSWWRGCNVFSPGFYLKVFMVAAHGSSV